MSDTADGQQWTAHQLKRMDEQTARETLPVAQYERWEDIQALYDDAAETQEEWNQEAEAVAEVTVSADMDALGTHVDIYGNDLLVYADIESPAFREATQELQDEFGDVTVEDPDAEGEEAFGDVDAERLDAMAEHLLGMLDTVLERWDGTEWDDLPPGQRESILRTARESWGVAGLLRAWGEISIAIREDYDEMEARMQSFRSAERRGNR